MKSSNFSFLILLGITSMLFLNISLVAGETESTIGNPNRIIDTKLEYAIPNGSMFVWKENSFEEMSNGTYTENDTDTDYALEQLYINPISNVSTNLTVQTYRNLTTTPICPIMISQWQYQYNDTMQINNTLAGIVQGMNYYPSDVDLSDVMFNDSSLFLAITNLMGGSLPFFDIIDELYAESPDNVTINDDSNMTIVSYPNSKEGNYLFERNVNAILKDIDGLVGFSLNFTFQFYLNASMNCYHVLNESIMGFVIDMFIVNNTNSLQNMTMIMELQSGRELVCSNLLGCDLYETLGNPSGIIMDWWILIVIMIAGIGATLLIALIVQRSKCDTVKEPLDHLACRIGNKYKPQEK